jgi:Rrf2 family protein
MKFSSQEEYGLRCLLRIGKQGSEKGMTIPEISRSEGITPANVAKLLRILRLGGFLESSRGQTGGYTLSRTPAEITISDVLTVLGGKLYDHEFCGNHLSSEDVCGGSTDCSIKSLWQTIQGAVDNVLEKLTLMDLMDEEITYTQIKIPGVYEKERL